MRGLIFGQREDLMTEEELANDEHHILMNSATKDTNRTPRLKVRARA